MALAYWQAARSATAQESRSMARASECLGEKVERALQAVEPESVQANLRTPPERSLILALLPQ